MHPDDFRLCSTAFQRVDDPWEGDCGLARGMEGQNHAAV